MVSLTSANRRVEAETQTRWRAEGWGGPKFRALFSLSRSPISIFSLSLSLPWSAALAWRRGSVLQDIRMRVVWHELRLVDVPFWALRCQALTVYTAVWDISPRKPWASSQELNFPRRCERRRRAIAPLRFASVLHELQRRRERSCAVWVDVRENPGVTVVEVGGEGGRSWRQVGELVVG